MKLYTALLIGLLHYTDATSAAEPVTSLLELREKNVVIQEWDLSCGAAVLTTLLRYQHGLAITEKQVASELIKRDEYLANPELVRSNQGFSLLDLKRYVERIGLSGDGFGQMAFDDLTDLAPVIVPVVFDNYNHFAIFRGFVGDTVLLADPAWGNRTLSREQFEQAWLEFGNLGKIGFTVTSDSGHTKTNQLAPTLADFVMLR